MFFNTVELKNPLHGSLELSKSKGGRFYIPEPDYFGPDRATFLVETGGMKIKVEYFLQVLKGVGWEDYEDQNLCPKGEYWKISFDDSDPNAPIYTFQHPSQLTSALAGVVQANLTFGDLAGSALGQSTGNTITLDTDAAGHGWFLDTTPWDNVEYVATSNPNEWVALPGSEASGKMDLLSVLLHEYGHVLGLNHSDEAHSLMSEDLKPGVRHTVSVEDMQALWGYLSDHVPLDPSSPNAPFNPLPLSTSLLFGFTRLRREATGQGINLPPLPGDPNAVSVTPAPTYSMSLQYERALHPDLYNGDFSILDTNLAQYGWDARGQAALELGALVLREDDRALSGLTQGFILPEGIQALRFTIKGAQFSANGNTPPDAFEAALINMATGQSAVSTGSLSHTDSLFNLQSNGVASSASAVTVTGLPAPGTSLLDTVSPITVTVDLSNVAAGSVLKLYFDLLGMGAQGSSITIDDVRLLTSLATNTAPLAVDDAVTTAEDAPLTFNMLANDQDAEGDTLAASIVQAPANGVLTANADGTYTYTPNANYFGTDTFIYTANDGDPSTGSGQGLDSNLTTVTNY